MTWKGVPEWGKTRVNSGEDAAKIIRENIKHAMELLVQE
jgi:hypothetical protein